MAVWLCEFESHPPYKIDSLAQSVEHNTFNVGVLGSSPKRITKITASLAQLVEHDTLNVGVQGSSPWGSTKAVF